MAKDEWQELWDARLEALERVLGKTSENVLHATIPFELGADIGGGADILIFEKHVPGIAYVTAELIGCADQVENDLGNFELMICHREESSEGPDLISSLAHYTLRTRLDPGATMDIGEYVSGSKLRALMFVEQARFTFAKRPAGILLAIGITKQELALCRKKGTATVRELLEKKGVFPFTDWNRKSLV